MASEATDSRESDDNKAEPASDKEKRKPAKEIGGPKGLEPTRYGDWERKGIVSDF
ncbi:MAG: DUF1674 domain-containing protein [Alphaproteobacteria bacterium]|nr:DUF1674 domain-containing protein [Alphaproteobacteria bacterium]